MAMDTQISIIILVICYFLDSASAFNLEFALPHFCNPLCRVKVKSNQSALINEDHGFSTFDKQCERSIDTHDCVTRNRKWLNMTEDDTQDDMHVPMPTCHQNWLTVTIVPYTLKSDLGEALKLNISIKIHNHETRAVVLRQMCLKNGIKDPYDLLCNKTRPMQWKKFLWSCRMFDHSNVANRYGQENLVYPISHNYDCFLAGTAYSEMAIHVILYPQMCRNIYTYRSIDWLHFETRGQSNYWLPLVYVDNNRNDCYFSIHFNLPDPNLGIKTLVIEILEVTSRNGHVTQPGSRDSLVHMRLVDLKNSCGIEYFTNLKMGSYLAFAYPKYDNRSSLSTYVQFNLSRDYCLEYKFGPLNFDLISNQSWLITWFSFCIFFGGILAIFIRIGLILIKKKNKNRLNGFILLLPKMQINRVDDVIHEKLGRNLDILNVRQE